MTAIGEVDNLTHALCGTTIGDELKIASGGFSRVMAIAGSDHDAVLMTGKLGDTSFWLNGQSGNFAASSHSSRDLPAWAQNFNAQHTDNQYTGKTWQPLLDAASMGGKNFSHTFDNSQFAASPWANQALIDFAKATIAEEQLGQHDTTDMLGVDFSSFEAASKIYGDYSPESLDLLLRFDQSLSDFLQFLDHKLGLDNCLIVFTACHGNGASAQFLNTHGLESGAIEAKTFRDQLNSALSSRLGNANWIESFDPPNVYFNLNAIDHSNFRQPDIEKLAAKLGRSVTGTAEIYGAFQLLYERIT